VKLEKKWLEVQAELAEVKAILNDTEKWLQWCDIKVLEQYEQLQAENKRKEKNEKGK
jgi:hypothetical protein